MEGATGIIPEELMYPAKLEEVLVFLEAAPIRGARKREILFGWQRAVGVRLTASQYNRVYLSGIDMPEPASKDELITGSKTNG